MKISFISKSSEEERYTLGIVYEPFTEDLQGDTATPEEIRNMCFGFMKFLQEGTHLIKSIGETVLKALEDDEEFQLEIPEESVQKGVLGYNHEEWPDGIGTIVENYLCPVDCEIGGQKVLKGTWLMGVIWSQEYWDKVKNEDITGYSMGGKGQRLPM